MQAEEEQERSAEDGRASAIGAASLEINPSGRAGEGSDAAGAESEPGRGGEGRERFGFGITRDGGWPPRWSPRRMEWKTNKNAC